MTGFNSSTLRQPSWRISLSPLRNTQRRTLHPSLPVGDLYNSGISSQLAGGMLQ